MSLYSRRENRPTHRHCRRIIWTLQRHDVIVCSAQPGIDVDRVQDRDHRLRVYRRDKLVRMARHHREPRALRAVLPESRDGRDRLIYYLSPYIALLRLLASASVSHRPGRAGRASIHRTRSAGSGSADRAWTPVRSTAVAPDCGRWSSARARHRREIPRYHVKAVRAVLLANNIGPAFRTQLDGIESVVARLVGRPADAKPFDKSQVRPAFALCCTFRSLQIGHPKIWKFGRLTPMR